MAGMQRSEVALRRADFADAANSDGALVAVRRRKTRLLHVRRRRRPIAGRHVHADVAPRRSGGRTCSGPDLAWNRQEGKPVGPRGCQRSPERASWTKRSWWVSPHRPEGMKGMPSGNRLGAACSPRHNWGRRQDSGSTANGTIPDGVPYTEYHGDGQETGGAAGPLRCGFCRPGRNSEVEMYLVRLAIEGPVRDGAYEVVLQLSTVTPLEMNGPAVVDEGDLRLWSFDGAAGEGALSTARGRWRIARITRVAAGAWGVLR